MTPRRFDAYAALQRRIKFLETRITSDQAELAQHRQALKIYEQHLAELKPPKRR